SCTAAPSTSSTSCPSSRSRRRCRTTCSTPPSRPSPAPRAPARWATARCSSSRSTGSSASAPAKSTPMRFDQTSEAEPMKTKMFSGLKTRTRAAALALLFGVAAAFAASPVLAQEAEADAPVAEAVAAVEDAAAEAEAAVAEAPAMEAAAEEAAAEEAADGTEAEGPAFDSGNVAWMLTSTLLVLLMVVPGLALFYGGMVRSKNVLSVLMQVLVVFSVVILVWVSYGYSAAFTDGNNFFGSFTQKAFLKGITTSSESGGLPELLFVVFQSTFAG